MFGATGDFVGRQAGGVQHGFDVFGDGHPGIQSETLEDDRHAGIQPEQGLVVIEHFALGGPDEAGEDAQDGRFAAARGTQQRHDFVGADAQADVFQHAQRLAVGEVEVVRDVAGFAQTRWFWCRLAEHVGSLMVLIYSVRYFTSARW